MTWTQFFRQEYFRVKESVFKITFGGLHKLQNYINYRPVIMYGSETWALRKREEQQLDRTEMRMLRWMLGISLRERRRNDDIRAEAGVVAISEKIREARMRWFGHIMRREEEDPVKVAWRHPIEGRRTVGRQRIRWRDIVERDLRLLNLREEEAQDRIYWRQRTRATDPTSD